MLNIKKHSIFSREEKGNCQEYQDRGGVLAVWAVLEAERQPWL